MKLNNLFKLSFYSIKSNYPMLRRICKFWKIKNTKAIWIKLNHKRNFKYFKIKNNNKSIKLNWIVTVKFLYIIHKLKRFRKLSKKWKIKSPWFLKIIYKNNKDLKRKKKNLKIKYTHIKQKTKPWNRCFQSSKWQSKIYQIKILN